MADRFVGDNLDPIGRAMVGASYLLTAGGLPRFRQAHLRWLLFDEGHELFPKRSAGIADSLARLNVGGDPARVARATVMAEGIRANMRKVERVIVDGEVFESGIAPLTEQMSAPKFTDRITRLAWEGHIERVSNDSYRFAYMPTRHEVTAVIRSEKLFPESLGEAAAEHGGTPAFALGVREPRVAEEAETVQLAGDVIALASALIAEVQGRGLEMADPFVIASYVVPRGARPSDPDLVEARRVLARARDVLIGRVRLGGPQR